MKEADITKALGQHLLTLPDVPYIVWENKDMPTGTPRPYLVIQQVRVSRRNDDLQGGTDGIIARGYMQVSVVTDLDEWATEAESIADNIAAHFPKGTRLTGATGVVTIMDAPDIKPATRNGSNWMVPVQIDYQGSTS